MFGNTTKSNYAVTIPGNIYQAPALLTGDMVLTRINTNPTPFTGSTVVTPATQTVCVNGVVNQIDGKIIVVAGFSAYHIYGWGAANITRCECTLPMAGW